MGKATSGPKENVLLNSILKPFYSVINFILMRVMVLVSRGNESVEKEGDNIHVFTKQPFEDNRANRDVIKQIAKYYSVPSSKVKIVTGLRSRKKILDINVP